MKKILFVLLSTSLLFISCSKEVDTLPAIPIQKFIGSFSGNLNQYNCGTAQVLLASTEGVHAKLYKDSETEFNGKLIDDEGNKIFSFTGKLDDSNDSKIKISQFIYESDTLFGGGEIVSGKLNLQFAAKSCPAENGQYTVTRVFKQQ